MFGGAPFGAAPFAALAGGSSGTAYTLTASGGTFALNGQPVTFRATLSIRASVGTFTLTGEDVALLRVRTLTAEGGVFTLTGQDVGLHYTARLVAGVGTFTLTGEPVTFSLSIPHRHFVVRDRTQERYPCTLTVGARYLLKDNAAAAIRLTVIPDDE